MSRVGIVIDLYRSPHESTEGLVLLRGYVVFDSTLYRVSSSSRRITSRATLPTRRRH